MGPAFRNDDDLGGGDNSDSKSRAKQFLDRDSKLVFAVGLWQELCALQNQAGGGIRKTVARGVKNRQSGANFDRHAGDFIPTMYAAFQSDVGKQRVQM